PHDAPPAASGREEERERQDAATQQVARRLPVARGPRAPKTAQYKLRRQGTIDKYNDTIPKWKEFVEAKRYDEVAAKTWTDSSGKVTDAGMRYMSEFIDYLNARPGMTAQVFEKSLGYVQMVVEDQVKAANNQQHDAALMCGFVREMNNGKAKVYLQNFREQRRQRKFTDEGGRVVYRDVLVDVPISVSSQQTLDLVQACMLPSRYKEGVVLDELLAIQTIVEYLQTHATAGRMEDVRKARLCMCFTNYLASMGQNEKGAKLFCSMLNEGKCRTGDKAVYTSAAMHNNPLLCLGGWMGILLMHRFSQMKEPFPNYLVPDDFMERSVLRSVKCFKALSDYETQNVYHRKTFDLVGLESSKVTHLNRGVMQRDMNDFGLWSEIGRHVG
ncbi:MAG: hypothetical protein ACRDL7_11045, partial [Gaiellaceae bacterium]